MSKDVVILTQPLGKNYGGLIQNYALQTVIKQMGMNVITAAREMNSSPLRSFLSKVKNQTYNRLIGQKRPNFKPAELAHITSEMQRFMDSEINMSPHIYSSHDLSVFFKENHFDAVIVGSDQTWRPMYSPDIYNYFLDFLVHNNELKKIAYASSFGTEKWEYTKRQTRLCRTLAQKFDAISVREKSGIMLCEKYLHRSAVWMLDPTLLMEKSAYLTLCEDVKFRKGLFCYILDDTPEKKRLVQQIAEKLELSVYKNQPERSIYDVRPYSRIEDYTFPSLESWIASFRDADFVVTDSFHGTIFSILFNKPFFSIVNEERGASRFYSLLEQLNLLDRLIIDAKNGNLEELGKEIDYERVNNVLVKLREESVAFLDLNLR